MTIAWMLYATCVGVLLAIAAILLERPLRERAIATRLVWAALLAGAIVWPATSAIRSHPPQLRPRR